MNPPPAKAEEMSTASTPRRACSIPRSADPFRIRRQDRLAPQRLVQQVHQRLLVAEQLHHLRKGREKLGVHRELLARRRLHLLDRAEIVAGPIAGAVGQAGVQAEMEGVLQPAQVVRIVVVEQPRIDLLDGGPAVPARRKVLHIVVGRAAGMLAAGEIHRLGPVGRGLDAGDVPPPLRIAPGKIDQHSVESVAPRPAGSARAQTPRW